MVKKIVISFQNRVVAIYSNLKTACKINGYVFNSLSRKKFPFYYRGLLFEKIKEQKEKDKFRIKITKEMMEKENSDNILKTEIANLKYANTILTNKLKDV